MTSPQSRPRGAGPDRGAATARKAWGRGWEPADEQGEERTEMGMSGGIPGQKGLHSRR